MTYEQLARLVANSPVGENEVLDVLIKEAKEAIKEDKRRYNIAIIKSINEDYDMGLIDAKERDRQVNALRK